MQSKSLFGSWIKKTENGSNQLGIKPNSKFMEKSFQINQQIMGTTVRDLDVEPDNICFSCEVEIQIKRIETNTILNSTLNFSEG